MIRIAASFHGQQFMGKIYIFASEAGAEPSNMKKISVTETFPRSRIATKDVYRVAASRNHVAALLELDVTLAREKIRLARKAGRDISFNGWLIRVIATALQMHPQATAFACGKQKIMIFRDVNISVMVEKETEGKRVPIPLLIEKAGEKTPEQITRIIREAREKSTGKQDIVLHRKPGPGEKLYYYLPGFLRRMVWKIMLKNPGFVFDKMGNAVVTSLNASKKLNGWFIHRSIHPVSFGIGAVLKKPVAVNSQVLIRDILNLTILMDHNVMDGVPMAKFASSFSRLVEEGHDLD